MRKFTEEEIIEFLNKSSYSGLEILFTAHLNYKSKIPFKLVDLQKAIGEISDDYSYGYLVATSSFGVIELTDKRGILNIYYLNEFIIKHIARLTLERAKKMAESDAISNFKESSYYKSLTKIVAFFEEDSSILD